MKAKNTNRRHIFLLGSLLSLTACGLFHFDSEYEKAQKLEAEKKIPEAIHAYYKFLRKNPDDKNAILAAQRIYQIASLNTANTEVMENSLKYVLLHADQSEERLGAQFQLAEFYFDRVNDYESAINHFNKYISLSKDAERKVEAKVKIAKSYFYLNNFYQAKTELEDILQEKNLNKALDYEARFLKANVLQSEKNYEAAIEVYRELILTYPTRSEKEQVYLNLSLCYEDSKNFKEAIAVLEPYIQEGEGPDFIKEKIEKIRFLISQQPGARGKIK